MAQSVHDQTEELEALEKAALEAPEPEQIEEKAAQSKVEPHPTPATEDKVYFIGYLLVALGLGGVLLLLQWKQSVFAPSMALKIQRYLLGALAVTVVLGISRLLEVYAIGRLRDRVARFNLKRVLRLVTVLVV